MRLVFKHLPLESIHSHAMEAARAAEAARLQGQFWAMHDKIFENQRELGSEKYVEWAAELGLDVEQFGRDMQSEEVTERIQSDLEEASSLGIRGTPAFFINGKYLSGAQPYARFQQMIEQELAEADAGRESPPSS